ncbi:lignan glucosyltransferase, partial [Genlisea aurea]
LIGRQKSAVRDAVVGAFHGRESNIPAGFVVDMFCTAMVDVADELGIPSYVFFTCGAATLGLCFHVQGLKDYLNEDISKFDVPGEFFAVPGYRNPFPTNVMPGMLYDKERREDFVESVRIFRRLKGILVNSFLELEEDAIKFMSEDTRTPPIYAVGPVLQDSGDETRQGFREIMDWLDEQPDSSVVFLCFGTRGAFDEDQVKEIAAGIQRSGHRFLWSLRKPPPNGHRGFPSEYENFEEILPAEFLNGNGKVIGWAPQAAVLAHRAVGGFVSHCGWNSTLESVWFGVPVAVWPLGAEQQANAFQLVKEFETAVEIKMDYRVGSGEKIPAEKIEAAIRELMDLNNPIRLKAKELKEKSRTTLLPNQSSSNF